LTPDGLVTIPSSEGDWVPASMIAAVRPEGPVLNRLPGSSPDFRLEPFFGHPGTNLKQPPEVPMLYLPRGLDNSSGEQVFVDSDRWGPVQGQLVHLSYGAVGAFLLLRDEFEDWIQGAVVPIAGEFESGVHRGRFNQADGQLYVSGMAGWGTYATADGCFQRVRFTGNSTQLPIGFHIHQNGIRISFAEPIDVTAVQDPTCHFAQAWNYRYSGAYGSPEYSHRSVGLRGHDVLTIASATVLEDQHSLFLEIPDLQLVNQLHLLVQSAPGVDHDLFMTVNRLDLPFEDFAGYQRRDKVLLPHPMLTDLRRPIATERNPFGKAIEEATPIAISAGRNLTFEPALLEVRAGEAIRLTLNNPDAVPHNWALLKPGTLQSVGQKCNELIADPEAVARHYIPQTEDVLAYTDVVEPYSNQTIYFRAPNSAGRYPYLCTFPGHWMVMNGILVVTEKAD
jgi:azurin